VLYAILAVDKPGSLADRLRVRPAHLERLEALQDEGRLVLAGPHPAIDSPDPGDAGFSGSLIVAEFADLGNAEAWAAADPYVEAGVYTALPSSPSSRCFPAEALNPARPPRAGTPPRTDSTAPQDSFFTDPLANGTKP
jgi:hypothetical protein